MLPKLRMRIEPSEYDPNESWVSADFEALSELYHIGAEVLRRERDQLKAHRLCDSQPPTFSALPVVRIAEAFGGWYSHNVSTRWPQTVTMSTGPTLDKDTVTMLVRDLSPSSILTPWVGLRDDWAGVGLASGSERASDLGRG